MFKIVLFSLAVIYLYQRRSGNKKNVKTASKTISITQELNSEELAKIEAERKAKEERNKLEQERILQQAHQEEQALLQTIQNSSTRIYFSYSLTNEDAPIYCLNPSLGNDIIPSSKTTLRQLYNEGWRVYDIDKTGNSAQLEDFNFLIRVSKISGI